MDCQSIKLAFFEIFLFLFGALVEHLQAEAEVQSRGKHGRKLPAERDELRDLQRLVTHLLCLIDDAVFVTTHPLVVQSVTERLVVRRDQSAFHELTGKIVRFVGVFLQNSPLITSLTRIISCDNQHCNNDCCFLFCLKTRDARHGAPHRPAAAFSGF